MRRVAYMYLPAISRTDVREVFRALEPFGFRITHIGKHDPPRKWLVSFDEAAEVIEQHDGIGTNTTFVADASAAIDLTFEIRDDPRWGFSTISMSFPDTIVAQSLGDDIYRRVAPYAYVSGKEGAGKGQQWEVLLVNATCPDRIKTILAGRT